MSDPKVIYLGPECEDEFCDGRTWADHVAWPDCDCNHKPVRYNLGSDYDAALAREAALREELEIIRPERDLYKASSETMEDFWREAQQHLTEAEKLFDAAITALNEIVKVSRIGEKPFEIATLAIGEMSALKPVAVEPSFQELHGLTDAEYADFREWQKRKRAAAEQRN